MNEEGRVRITIRLDRVLLKKKKERETEIIEIGRIPSRSYTPFMTVPTEITFYSLINYIFVHSFNKFLLTT